MRERGGAGERGEGREREGRDGETGERHREKGEGQRQHCTVPCQNTPDTVQ